MIDPFSLHVDSFFIRKHILYIKKHFSHLENIFVQEIHTKKKQTIFSSLFLSKTFIYTSKNLSIENLNLDFIKITK